MSGPASADARTAEALFVALYRANARALLGFALRRAPGPEEAADVVAETMAVAWRRPADVPAGDDARLWLYGVARHVLANSRRGARRRDRLGERLRRDVRELVVPDPASGVAAAVEVRRALAALSPEDRELIQLTAWEGLGPAEVATVLGLTPVAARSRLHRARGRLRALLGDGHAPQPPPAGHVLPDGPPLVRKAEEGR